MNQRHHAFVVEAEAEKGIEMAQAWAEKELGMKMQGNPDIVVLRYGLLSVDDARNVSGIAASAPLIDESKVLIISASRIFHEAQNVLLKLFEEPPRGTYMFLVLPTLGGLLPTLRSRVQVLKKYEGESIMYKGISISEAAEEFMKASKEKRSAMIKKLANGKDEEERRELRDEAIEIINGVETALVKQGIEKNAITLEEIATFRGFMYDRSAPVRMILEHLSLVLPKDLL